MLCHGEFLKMCLSLTVASSGTATINADGTVQVLVEEAYPLENFDLQVCLSFEIQCNCA